MDVDINFCSRGCFSNLFLLSNLTVVVVVVVVVVGVILVAGEEKEEEEEEEELKALRLRASALRANDRAFLRIVVVVFDEKGNTQRQNFDVVCLFVLRDEMILFFFVTRVFIFVLSHDWKKYAKEKLVKQKKKKKKKKKKNDIIHGMRTRVATDDE